MLKTTLPQSISSIPEAKHFLKSLHDNGEAYHPEDDAHEIDWVNLPESQHPTIDEADLLNRLMGDIYKLPGNEDMRSLAFDPCGFLLDLNKIFLVVDRSGRGFTSKVSLADLKDWDEVNDEDDTEKEIIEWLDNAEVGDQYIEIPSLKITRID